MEVKCKECGKQEKLHWTEATNERLIREKLCFSCNFWNEKIGIKNDPMVVRIDGCHYQIEDEIDEPIAFRGYGGRKFVILFDDGRKIVTTNLWFQGEIPKRFQERLPDNAKFIDK